MSSADCVQRPVRQIATPAKPPAGPLTCRPKDKPNQGHPKIDPNNPLPPRIRRRRTFAAILAIAIVAAALAVPWMYRLDLARMAAIRLLERSGFGPVDLTVSHLDLSGLRARDIGLYGGGIRIAALTLAYGPSRLAAGLVDRAKITGLEATLTAAGDDIATGGVPLRFSASTDGAAAAGGFPISTVEFVDAHLAFDGPTGRLEANFSTELVFSGTNIHNKTFAVDLTMPLAGQLQTIHIEAPELAISTGDGGGPRLRFDRMAVRIKNIPWIVENIGGGIAWQGGRFQLTIDSSRIGNTQTPAIAVPLELTGDVALQGSRIDFAAHVLAKAPGDKGQIELDAKGFHDRAAGNGQSSIAVAPVMFQANGLQPRDLLPALGDSLPALTGSAAISGGVTWRSTTLSPKLTLHIAGGAYEPEGASLRDIHGDIEFTGLWPVATAPGQVLRGVVEAGGLAPSNATLTFHLLPKPALGIESLRMEFAGGQIAASPFTIDPARPNFATSIGVRQIDLEQILKLVGIDGLGGSGKIDGTIPLAITGGKIAIRDGRLAASGPGVLRVRSDALPKQIADAGESMTLVLSALADFHYDTLSMDLAETASGEGTVALRLQGRNPALLEGRAFNLNIRLDSNFDRLIDLALRSMAAARELLRRTAGSARQ